MVYLTIQQQRGIERVKRREASQMLPRISADCILLLGGSVFTFVRAIGRIVFFVFVAVLGLVAIGFVIDGIFKLFEPTKTPAEMAAKAASDKGFSQDQRDQLTRKILGSIPEKPKPTMPVVLTDPGHITTKSATGLDYATVLEDYENNEIAAEQRYKGKRMRVKGPIDSIGKDILGSPYVTIGKPLQSLQCMFPRSSAEYLATLNKGEIASFECTVSGKLINVILRDCEP